MSMHNRIQLLKKIRLFELERALHYIPFNAKILEIGAGSGWQAKELSLRGYSVEAVEVKGSEYENCREWPVKIYDGMRLPFRDDSFDVVFSSNVFEHVMNVESFQSEVQRVLMPNGIAIIILPSGSWRFWSNISHYFFMAKVALHLFASKLGFSLGKHQEQSFGSGLSSGTWYEKIIKAVKYGLLPPTHGLKGNFLTEMYYFSRWRWIRLFEAAGWTLESHVPTNLFYTYYFICGEYFSLEMRNRAARWFGSACRIFVLGCN